MAEPAWMAEANKLVGLQEIVGSKHEAKVVAFFREAGNDWVKDDETAWCGAFVAAMFARAGMPETRPPGERANALRARQWLNVGEPVDVPRPGDLAIFWRGNKDAATGHVAFYVATEDDKIVVLGGNQSNAVSIARYPKSRLLGFRRVAEKAVQTPKPPPAPQRPQPEPPSAPPPSAWSLRGILAAIKRMFRWPDH